MDPILDIAKRHKLKIIEDAAQAIGATYKGRKAGSMSDVAALSFFPSKNLGGFGDGGMIVTNDEAIADKIRMLRVHGSAVRYVHSAIGMNSRLDNLQAAVLIVKLKYLDKWLKGRKEKAEYYNTNLKDLPLGFPHCPSYNTHTYHLYTLRVKSGLEKIIKFITDKGIEARTYYPIPLHLQDCYKSLGCNSDDMKESEKAAREVFSIPIYPELERSEQDYIIGTIKDFFRK
jgi:dTDP-4-amino-4,6-dideoxygalactose transaminase